MLADEEQHAANSNCYCKEGCNGIGFAVSGIRVALSNGVVVIMVAHGRLRLEKLL